MSKKCNGIVECIDKSDELKCGNFYLDFYKKLNCLY